MERPRQRMLHPANGHALFLHRLQQRRLGPGTRSVDLIRHQQLTEHRAGNEAEGAAAIGFVQHLAAHDIGGHQIGRELDALGVETEHDAQGFDEPAFAETGHADQQRVSTGQQGDQRLVDHILLPKNGPPDRRTNRGDARAEGLRLGENGDTR